MTFDEAMDYAVAQLDAGIKHVLVDYAGSLCQRGEPLDVVVKKVVGYWWQLVEWRAETLQDLRAQLERDFGDSICRVGTLDVRGAALATTLH